MLNKNKATEFVFVIKAACWIFLDIVALLEEITIETFSTGPARNTSQCQRRKGLVAAGVLCQRNKGQFTIVCYHLWPFTYLCTSLETNVTNPALIPHGC